MHRILLAILITTAVLGIWLILMLPVHAFRAVRRLFSDRHTRA